jgi:hypothetical protein
MAAKKTDDVEALLDALDHPRRAEIESVRALILGADPRIREGIKWNAPSYSVTDHFATFKLRPGDAVQVVFHTGAKGRADLPAVQVDDPAGLLTWAAPDRCVATLRDRADVEARGDALADVVRQWIAQLEGAAPHGGGR